METVIARPPEPEPVPPPATPEPTPPAGPKNNILSIVSLVLGIVGILSLCGSLLVFLIPIVNWVCGCLTFLLGVAALVTGFMARNQIKTSGEGGDKLALAGLIMGAILVVLLLCGMLVSVVLVLMGPAVGNVFSTINSSLK